MKLAHSPRTFSFVFIAFSFLLLQFGLINHFIVSPNPEPLPIPENTQAIPDTNLPDGAILEIEESSLFAGASGTSNLDVELDPQRYSGVDPSFFSAPVPEYSPSAEYDAEPLLAASAPRELEELSAEFPPPGAMGGAASYTPEVLVEEIPDDPDFDTFLEQVAHGDPETITGVYVAGLLSLRVLQQPAEDVAFVSNEDGTATQFQSPALYGVIGLLAHNFLSGKHFLSLVPGQEIRIVYGSGSYKRYQVSSISDYERLTRFDIRSDFRNIETDAVLSSKDLFTDFYREGNYLTFQTCLEGAGYSNWGVRMISAVPIE
jgi:hypothetical protein